MPEEERLRYSLAALYAYGCNCGPRQAARALGLLKSQVVYMRRRYMATPRLMAAASTLAHAYQQTRMAERLGDPNVLMTDSMQVRTLHDSLIARQHHRYLSGKSTLLYQHVAANCICRFTQALLCNVSEAIHMLVGVLACRDGDESIINICDSAGKSDLVFGFSGLLNILLYPRVRSGHLMLWGIGKQESYKNIGHAIAGPIRLDRVDDGWRDMMWILASIASGAGKPAVILERLAVQPMHPATLGFQELGKLERSLYLLRYGTDMDLRGFVAPLTARREHWNKFSREVQAFGDLVREKTIEDTEEVFWFLTVVQNAIVLWNALSIEDAIRKTSDAGFTVTEADLAHVLPTGTGNINFGGKFDIDMQRPPPFVFRRVEELEVAAPLREQA
jgi:TnpA family transposase